MHVDQKQETTINFLDGRIRDFVVRKDAWGFRLSSVSKEEVVHIVLSANDFHKLRWEILESERTELKKTTPPVPEKRENGLGPVRPLPEIRENGQVPVSPCIFQWSTADWLSFN